MKKKLLFVTVAALALASCSSDETVAVNQGDAINIRAYQTGLTRAADASLASGKSFKVTAFPTGTTSTAYIPKIVFTSDGTTFTSASKYYWKTNPATALDFYAWAPSTLTPATDDYHGFTIEPSTTTISDQPDLIYAVSKNWYKDNNATTGIAGTQNGSSGVALNFRHAESKVVINLQNTNANLKITVKDVAIGYIKNKGTFTWDGCTNGTSTSTDTDGHDNAYYLKGTCWNLDGATNTSYTVTMESTGSYNVFDGTTPAKGLKSTAADYEMILIPQVLTTATAYTSASGPFEGAYISVELMIENKLDPGNYLAGDGTNYVTAMWPLLPMTWLPGHKYTYIVDLAGGGYYPTEQEGDGTTLDPIINSADEIKFVGCTVDEWIVTTPAGDQPVSN